MHVTFAYKIVILCTVQNDKVNYMHVVHSLGVRLPYTYPPCSVLLQFTAPCTSVNNMHVYQLRQYKELFVNY